jgi:O-antigen ligase
VVGTTFFSLSSGAYVCMAVQVMLMSWGFVLRSLASRWKLLVGLAILAFVVIEVGSNRTAFQVMSSYLAFDPGTAYWRVLIAKYGLEEVWRHPVFGLGQKDWVRPSWMHDPTVDNFWLLQGMRHGIPGFLFAVGLYVCCILQLVRARPADSDARRNRDGLAFSLIGLGVAIITVHLWGATYNFFLFLLGATAWFGAVEQQPQATSETRRPSGSRSPAQPTRDPERGGIEGA